MYSRLAAAALGAFWLAGCGSSNGKAAVPAGASEPEIALAALKDLRVFFGHQSVGSNILDGVRDLAPEVRVERRVTPPDGPMIAEAMIGKNGSPDSKLDHFASVMEALGTHVDIAMMKFCYVDFDSATNVERVKARYAATYSALESAYPETEFLHVTVPLTVTQSGPKALIKKLIGRPLAGEHENPVRAGFNDWLRQTYPAERIFDLAAVESHAPDGTPVTYELDGKTYPMLYPAYSYDGEHLGEDGRRRAASAFLRTLEQASARRR